MLQRIRHLSFSGSLAVVVFIAAIFYSCLITRFRTGLFNDDAVYVLVARDLLNHQASHMLPSIKPDYPLPGVPLILSPIAKFFSPSQIRLKWVAVAVTLLTLFLLGIWLRRWLSPRDTLIVVSLYAFNPIVAKYSGILMPAPFFTLALIATFLLLRRVIEQPGGPASYALGAVLGWGCLLRGEGFVLLLSAVVTLVAARTPWRTAVKILYPVFLWGIVFWLWSHRTGMQGSDYASDLIALVKFWPDHFFVGFRDAWNLLITLVLETALAVRVNPTTLSVSVASLLVLSTFVASQAGYQSLWQKAQSSKPELAGALTFCSLYLVSHIVWRVALPRYCMALLPFMALFIFQGLSRLLAPFPYKRWVLGAVMCGVLSSYTWTNGYAVYEARVFRNPLNAPPLKALTWLRRHTAKGQRVLSPLSPSVVLYSNRPAVPMPKTSNPEFFLAALVKAQIQIIVDRPTEFVTTRVAGAEDQNKEWARMRKWVSQYPEYFSKVYEDHHERVRIFRVNVNSNIGLAVDDYAIALHHLRAGRWSESRQAVLRSLENYPEFAMGNNLLGATYFAQGKYAEAVEVFEKAARASPYSALLRVNLASTYHKLGRTAQSINTLNEAMSRFDAAVMSEREQRIISTLVESWNSGQEVMFY